MVVPDIPRPVRRVRLFPGPPIDNHMLAKRFSHGHAVGTMDRRVLSAPATRHLSIDKSTNRRACAAAWPIWVRDRGQG